MKNLQPFGYECPNCALHIEKNMYEGLEPTARIFYIKNEIYKKPAFYVKCKVCNFTTPAFDTSREALNQWLEHWIDVESKVCKDMFENK